jgi:hypothetical protein
MLLAPLARLSAPVFFWLAPRVPRRNSHHPDAPPGKRASSYRKVAVQSDAMLECQCFRAFSCTSGFEAIGAVRELLLLAAPLSLGSGGQGRKQTLCNEYSLFVRKSQGFLICRLEQSCM